jgi:hypothetical protein
MKRGLRCTSTWTKGGVTHAAEAMDLPGLDDQNVTGPGLELLAVHDPDPAAFAHELDLVVRMTMGPRTTPQGRPEQERGDIHVAVIGSHELVGAALEW